MGREMEGLRWENSKYKVFELSQYLNKDLLAYEAGYRELDELNTQVEGEKEELENINAEMGETILSFRDQFVRLGAQLQGLDYQPSCADEEQGLAAYNTGQADSEDMIDLGLTTSSNGRVATDEVQSSQRLQASLERKHSELEKESDAEQEQRKTRRRK